MEDELRRLEARLRTLAVEMAAERARGDWRAFYSTRHLWSATANLHRVLYLKHLEAMESQSRLFDVSVGQPHDRPLDAA